MRRREEYTDALDQPLSLLVPPSRSTVEHREYCQFSTLTRYVQQSLPPVQPQFPDKLRNTIDQSRLMITYTSGSAGTNCGIKWSVGGMTE